MQPISFYPSARPDINIGRRDARELSLECWAAIKESNDPPTLFNFQNKAVRVVQTEKGPAEIERLDEDILTKIISDAADLYETNAKGEKRPGFLPRQVAKYMLADPSPPLPRLARIVYSPVFAGGWRLIQQPGYDTSSGILYLPAANLGFGNLHFGCTPEYLAWASNFLLNFWLKDFPFVSDSDKAHAISVAILSLVHLEIEGNTPIHVISKKRAGEGGTLLATLLMLPALGYSLPRLAPPQGEAEWRRTIFAVLLGGREAILIDNLAERLSSSTLAAGITGPSLVDRTVRTSSSTTASTNCIWLLTGIQFGASPDIARRCLMIRLDSDEPHPELRTGFQIPNIEQWTKQNRALVLTALITLVLAWISAGCKRSTRVWGGFEEYTAIIGGILENAGIPGFLENNAMPKAVNEMWSFAAEAFCKAMALMFPAQCFSAKEGLDAARQYGLAGYSDTSTDLGKLLGRLAGQNFAGFMIRRAKLLRGTQQWAVDKVGES